MNTHIYVDFHICISVPLTDDSDENKKAKGTKKCVIKRKLKFEGYKHCLEATHLENKIKHLEKNKLNLM